MLALNANHNSVRVVIDRSLNPQLAKEAANMLIFPDYARFPRLTAYFVGEFPYVLCDAFTTVGMKRREHVLHPDLAPMFAPIAGHLVVGLETPRDFFLQRNFSRWFREALKDVVLHGHAEAAQVEGWNAPSLPKKSDMMSFGRLSANSTTVRPPSFHRFPRPRPPP